MSRFPAGEQDSLDAAGDASAWRTALLTPRETHPHSGRRCWRRGERIRMVDDAADAAGDASA